MGVIIVNPLILLRGTTNIPNFKKKIFSELPLQFRTFQIFDEGNSDVCQRHGIRIA